MPERRGIEAGGGAVLWQEFCRPAAPIRNVLSLGFPLKIDKHLIHHPTTINDFAWL